VKTIATIDIGTNTALLLIAKVAQNGDIDPLFEKESIVRLGEGVDENGVLKAEAISRTMKAIGEHMEVVRSFEAEEVIISGTSAVRDAKNRDVIIDKIKNRFDINMRVLAGEEEARLTYFGALSNKKFMDDILLIDIGGGSTEFIHGNQTEIKSAISIDIGSVRLTERFIKHDPITREEYFQIEEFVRKQLDAVSNQFSVHPQNLIGVAGTITTLAAIRLKLDDYDGRRIDNSTLSRDEVRPIVDLLKRKTLDERKKIIGLRPQRADVILAGTIILLESMRQLSIDELLVSDRGLRYGLIRQESTRYSPE